MADQLTTEVLDEERSPSPADVEVGGLTWRERRRQRADRRVSRWDRPPEPHDWRFFVGMLGKSLIVTGLLMFGFVAYQLWGTGIEYAAAQNSLESEFEQQLAELGVDPDGAIPNRAVDAPSALQPIDSAAPTVSAEPGATTSDEPPADAPDDLVPTALDLSEVAVEKPAPIVIPGETLFRLDVPRIHDDPLFVVPGVALSDLKKGPGHYSDTPLPGTLGNSAVAGHRTTYGAPFFDVDQLRPADEIIATMAGTGERFVYLVTSIEVVSAEDYWVVTTRDPSIAELTLTSCHPKYTARDRIVVHSVLDPSQSSVVGTAAFYELNEPATTETIPGDDPTLTAAPVATAPEAPPTSSSVSAAPTTTVTEATVPTVTTGATIDTPQRDVEDAFGQGWFADPAAWLQIALWGLALVIISLLAFQVSKKARRYSVGFVVGFLPFVFCLYFFYQNVNRLLPPGL